MGRLVLINLSLNHNYRLSHNPNRKRKHKFSINHSRNLKLKLIINLVSIVVSSAGIIMDKNIDHISKIIKIKKIILIRAPVYLLESNWKNVQYKNSIYMHVVGVLLVQALCFIVNLLNVFWIVNN